MESFFMVPECGTTNPCAVKYGLDDHVRTKTGSPEDRRSCSLSDILSGMNHPNGLQLHSEATRAFNELAEGLIAEVRPVPGTNEAETFRPDVFVAGQIPEADIIGEIRVAILDTSGNEVGKSFTHGEHRLVFNWETDFRS
jgi:hypothetical protein